MISIERWPQPAARVFVLAQRFQKFLVVGSIGLAVNQGMLFVLRHIFEAPLYVASPTAILVSMALTFALNELWTWHDRGRGLIVHRLMMYLPINTVGLTINFSVLSFLVHEYEWHYLIANLVGAALAAVSNFLLNHLITWRD